RILQRLARTERSADRGPDPDLETRARIATRARLPLARLERAEAGDLHTITLAQRFRDHTVLRTEDRIDGLLRVRLAQVRLGGKRLCQLRLVHVPRLALEMMGSPATLQTLGSRVPARAAAAPTAVGIAHLRYARRRNKFRTPNERSKPDAGECRIE